MNEKDEDLFEAIKGKDLQRVKDLINSLHPANVNAATPDGWTPLMEAASLDDKEKADESASKIKGKIADVLLKADANPNAKKKYGWTALMEAAHCGNSAVLNVLLSEKYAADTTSALDGKWTALSAAYEGWSSATPERANVYKQVAEKLRQSGAE